MASKEAEEYFESEWADNRVYYVGKQPTETLNKITTEEAIEEAFDAGVNSIITKLKDEFINVPKEDILERALDDYFSGCIHFCSNDEDIEKLFSHVIDYFIRKC